MHKVEDLVEEPLYACGSRGSRARSVPLEDATVACGTVNRTIMQSTIKVLETMKGKVYLYPNVDLSQCKGKGNLLKRIKMIVRLLKISSHSFTKSCSSLLVFFHLSHHFYNKL